MPRIEIVETGYAPEDVAGLQALIEYRRNRYGLEDPGLWMLVNAFARYHNVMSRPVVEVDMDKKMPYITAELYEALKESLILQSHYAQLLNQYDAGKRLGFLSPEAWIARLRETGKLGAASMAEVVVCRACGYQGRIDTYLPCLTVNNDCKCPKCGSTNNQHNTEYQKTLFSAEQS